MGLPQEIPEERKPIKYGELVILGYNGFLPPGDRGRRRSKFVLYQKTQPTGVRKSKHYVVTTPHSSEAILNTKQHSISFTLSRSKAIIVEYMPDDQTDMFQIGRSSDPPIDFVVMDTIAGDKKGEERLNQSTISRFACRILADRRDPSICRIYAAGFDASRNIFLGEKATKWQDGLEIDGLTTNGVLIMHPNGSFADGEAKPGLWREVSVGGGVFTTRESRSAQQKGTQMKDETNILVDGTLIDLCGATLLWRSAAGLAKSPSKEYIEELVDQLNAGKPLCPVGLNTLVVPRRVISEPHPEMDQHQPRDQPYAYLTCGHVQGHHSWGQEEHSDSKCCSLCFEVGPVVKLCMGVEPAFYINANKTEDKAFYALNPCGHMTTEKTARFWSTTPIPHGTNGFDAICPFCATPLEGFPGYTRLIFQDHVD